MTRYTESRDGESVFYSVVAPCWRAPGRPLPGLGSRPLLRWEVVRETRPGFRPGPIRTWGWEHCSFHWTRQAASREASRLNEVSRHDS